MSTQSKFVKPLLSFAFLVGLTSCGDGLGELPKSPLELKKSKEAEKLCKKEGKEVSKEELDAYLQGKTKRVKCQFSEAHINGRG
jgi:hypothetical protein